MSNSLLPEDCSLPDSSIHGDSSGKSTRVGCDALLQGIFPTQGSNPGPPHCMQILYQFSHQGSPNHFIVILNSVFYLCRAEAPQMVDVLLGCLYHPRQSSLLLDFCTTNFHSPILCISLAEPCGFLVKLVGATTTSCWACLFGLAVYESSSTG